MVEREMSQILNLQSLENCLLLWIIFRMDTSQFLSLLSLEVSRQSQFQVKQEVHGRNFAFLPTLHASS